MANEIIQLFDLPFDMAEKQKREEILSANFANTTNVKKLVVLLN